MDIKSESEGNFFTFAAGKNDEKYVFFRVADNLFRFAATTDSWRDETELVCNLDGTKWHNYTIVVNGADTKLYIDGKLTLHTTETHGQVADMYSGTSCYIGKSYYADDTYFKGYIDNIKIYKTALTESEILESEALPVPAFIKGDVNGDGELSAADLVSMQKYILGNGELANSENGDLCEDGRIDIFDLILLRREIIYHSIFSEVLL